MKQLLMLELRYPNKSGNRSAEHSGDNHVLSEDAQEYRREVARVAGRAGADGLRLAGLLKLPKDAEPGGRA